MTSFRKSGELIANLSALIGVEVSAIGTRQVNRILGSIENRFELVADPCRRRIDAAAVGKIDDHRRIRGNDSAGVSCLVVEIDLDARAGRVNDRD